MTPEKALELLGLTGKPGPDEIRRGYAAIVAEPRRLASEAPSPSLRAVYERHAAQLAEARDLLLGGAAPARPARPSPLSATQARDLPLREPSSAPGDGDGRPKPSATPGDGLAVHDTMRNYPRARATAPRAYPGEDPASQLGIEPGRVLADRYEVRALIGAGGMGAVYAAFDRVRGEDVAVKVLLPHLLADPKAHERFLNEAKVASGLSHPGIVRVFDLHETAGMTFLTMELLRGRSLRDEILARKESARRFGIEEVREIADQLCDALAHAHSVTVHRDVKPENVWVREDGAVKLMDFGIARLLRPSQFTSTGMALGTAYYMAPEQLRGAEDVDHRADQFAVAVMLYELLTGEVPQGAILAPREVRRSVPSGMSEAVMKALAGDPQKRHADITAFRRALSARGKGSVRRKLAMAAVAVALVGAVALIPGLRGTADAEAARPGSAEPTADARAAEVEYPALAEKVEVSRKEAEGVGVKVDAGKASGDEVAEVLADLWHRHPQQRGWLKQGKQALDAARKHAEKKEYVDAVASLKEAEAEYARPARWFENASKALASAAKSRVAIRELVLALPADSSRALADLPEALARRVEEKLNVDDGDEGPAEAEGIARALPQYRALLESRSGLAKLAQEGKAGMKVDDLSDRHQAASTRLQEADRALASGRLHEAETLYASAASDFRQVNDDLSRYLARCREAASNAASSGDYAAAVSAYDKYLELRPGDPDAVEAKRRATFSGQLAKVRALDRDGDLDEAVNALATLRRESRGSREVESLVTEMARKMETSGRKQLGTKHYDEAKQEFQRLRRLVPGQQSSALVDLVDAQRRSDDEQARLAKDLADKAERERQKREADEEIERQAALARAKQRAIDDEARQRQLARQQEIEQQRAFERQRQVEREAELERQREAEQQAANASRNRRQQTFGAAGQPAQGGGIYVIQANAGTPSQRFGLEPGDVIYTINGRAVNTINEYFEAVWSSPDLMEFTYRNVRDGRTYKGSVYLNR